MVQWTISSDESYVTRLLSDSVSNGEQVQWTCESSEGRELERAAGAETSSVAIYRRPFRTSF